MACSSFADGGKLKRRDAESAEEMSVAKLCVLCASAFPILKCRANLPAITQPPQVCFDSLLKFRGRGEVKTQRRGERREKFGS
jgi:hypothetical protein